MTPHSWLTMQPSDWAVLVFLIVIATGIGLALWLIHRAWNQSLDGS